MLKYLRYIRRDYFPGIEVGKSKQANQPSPSMPTEVLGNDFFFFKRGAVVVFRLGPPEENSMPFVKGKNSCMDQTLSLLLVDQLHLHSVNSKF